MPTYNTVQKRWLAVQSRDKAADDQFFYGVTSTGVYCYPSCPSKAALRANTVFFSTRNEATDAGLRACKRCRSDEAPLAVRQAQLVEDACQLIKNAPSSAKVEDIADQLSVSRYHLQKLFQHYLSLSPKAYAKAARAQDLERALNASSTVTEAVYAAGYESASTYYAEGAERLGMSAKRYQSKGDGLHIRYGFGTTRYGKIVVGCTDKGVCCILFGDTQQHMLEDLETRFSKATLVRDTQKLEPVIASVVEQIDTPSLNANLSVDVQGTAFQEQVWQALRQIPTGSTATYSEVATSIGKPKASRAVATACAANPLAVIVPCHRVVRASGELSGYRWGVERKRALLTDEKEENSKPT